LFQLWLWSALDNTGELTKLGRCMTDFPLDPPLSKMLLSAHKHGACSTEFLIVVSMLKCSVCILTTEGSSGGVDSAREKFFVNLWMMQVDYDD